MLARRAKKVASANDPKAKAKELWNSKSSASWGDIRNVLKAMSTGIERCMYCEDSSGTDIEHFYPKSTYPEFAHDWDNYLWACTACNSNYKRSQFPLDGRWELLINPTWDDPADYLEFNPTTGRFVAIGGCSEGRESIRVFGLARFDKHRRDAWRLFQAALRCYSSLHARGQLEDARELRALLPRLPFSGVLAALLGCCANPSPRRFVDDDVIAILGRHPELQEIFD